MHDKPPPFVAGGEPQTLLFRPTQPDNFRQAALPQDLLSDDTREAVLNMEGSRLEQRAAAGGDDSQQAANTSPEAPAQMECWACATLVQIPVVDGKLAPDFKCGFCGAITQKKKKRHCHGARRKRPGLGGNCCDRLCFPFEWIAGTWVCQLAGAGVQWVVVLIVLGIITSLISMGVGCILPRLQWQALHLLLAALFSFNIYFNYYQVVRQSPGSPQEIPGFQSLKTVPRTPYNPVCNGDGDAHNNDSPHKLKDSSLMGAFDNYTLCTYCDDFKPPQAHHCRICKRCVLEMDHHCPFVNNCIGASNVRPFMLFLFWASTATFYTMCAGIWALYYNSHLFLPRLARYRLLSMNPFTSSVMALVDMIADGLFGKDKLWIIGVVYSVFVSAGVTIGVGVLFALQMQQLFAGVSYIDALKHGKDSGKGASRMVHLQKVFGTGHPLTWILPRTTLPKGAATLQHLVKKGE